MYRTYAISDSEIHVNPFEQCANAVKRARSASGQKLSGVRVLDLASISTVQKFVICKIALAGDRVIVEWWQRMVGCQREIEEPKETTKLGPASRTLATRRSHLA